MTLHEDRSTRLGKKTNEFDNYRGICLLSVPEKFYGRVLIETLLEVIEGKVSEQQGGFRKEKGCLD